MLLKDNDRLTTTLKRSDASRDSYRFQLDRLKPVVKALSDEVAKLTAQNNAALHSTNKAML
jgi:phage shock protein A